jgi:translation initiation factor IF-2
LAEKDKVRVYELAKELKIDSRRLIDLLHRLHVENIKNHMSTVEPEAVTVVRNIMEGKLPTAEEAPAVPAAPQAPPRPKAPTPAPRVQPRTTGFPGPGPTRPAPGPAMPEPPPNRRPVGVVPPPIRREQMVRREQPAARTGDAPATAVARPPMPVTGPRSGIGAPRPAGTRPPAGPSSAPRAGGPPRPGGAPRPGRPPVGPPPATPARGKDSGRRGPGSKDRRGPRQGSGRGRRWDEGDEFRSRARHFKPKSASSEPVQPVNRRIVLSGTILVKDLADQLGVKAGDLIKRLMELGVMATVNHELDRETAVIVAQELGANVEERASQEEQEAELIQGEEDRSEELRPRPPVVTVMGHVDHGKTSLLDRIRSSRVTAHEAGGITQHIGASVVEWHGRQVVFLDTPGHEAFTAMRARGAQVTDVAVLVVAANDGVMPQTIEAIRHAQAAGVPVVVAINKIDLEGANPERVRQSLTEYGLVPDEWGGDTMMVPVSAQTGEGIDKLLESILLQADILDIRANPERAGQGSVIEAQLDRGRGAVATVLVQRGTLRVGDAFVSGPVWGRVRALINDRGQRVKEATPSMPVEVLGFNEVPQAGDDFIVLADDKQARDIADARRDRRRAAETQTGLRGVSLDEFYQRLKDEAMKDLNLVIKADVQGSAEALAESLSKMGHEEARVRILHSGVGAVTESDVMLASASGAIILGFGVSTEAKARQLAEREHVDVRTYRVIYDLLDDVRQALTGMLAPKFEEVILGRVEVREVFRVPRVGAVAGSYVLDGKVNRGAQVRVIRDGAVVHEGPIASLRRFKDDVREVQAGFECGIGLERFNDIKVGDQLEVFTQEEVKAS